MYSFKKAEYNLYYLGAHKCRVTHWNMNMSIKDHIPKENWLLLLQQPPTASSPSAKWWDLLGLSPVHAGILDGLITEAVAASVSSYIQQFSVSRKQYFGDILPNFNSKNLSAPPHDSPSALAERGKWYKGPI